MNKYFFTVVIHYYIRVEEELNRGSVGKKADSLVEKSGI